MIYSVTKPLAFWAALLMLILAAVPAGAADLPKPSGQVLLTIDGNIANTTDGKTAQLDRQQLEALGRNTLKTSNPFVKTVHTYGGPYLSAILDHVGAEGTVIKARALDGYVVDIPIEDVRKYPVLLAMTRDGEVMRVRNKGPLWVIYPVDQFEELSAESFSGRSIWQLTHLTIE